MKKSQLTLLAAAFVATGSTGAFGAAFSLTSVDPASGQYSAIEDASGVLVTAGGGYAAVGSFSSDPGAFGATPDLLAAFNAYASGTFGGENVGNADGSVFISSGDTIPDSFNNADVYIVFGNGDTFGSSTEIAVISTGRTFPDDDPNNPVPIAFDFELGAALQGSVVPGLGTTTNNQSIAVLDGFGATPGPNGVGLVPVVPEPSAGILALFGVAFAALRRRR